MDERRDVPARSGRSWKGPVGMTAALVLSFAWGALAYRELGATHIVQGPVVAAAVAGSESAPAWVGDFVTAFCDADEEHVAAKLGPPLDAEASKIADAFASREWSCADTRFLGGGESTTGEFYAYVTIDDGGGEQWWVFTVVDEKVVAIE